jgi:hypothetical protein
MMQGELIYLIGVIAAMVIFTVTLAYVTYTEKQPPVGGPEQDDQLHQHRKS